MSTNLVESCYANFETEKELLEMKLDERSTEIVICQLIYQADSIPEGSAMIKDIDKKLNIVMKYYTVFI